MLCGISLVLVVTTLAECYVWTGTPSDNSYLNYWPYTGLGKPAASHQKKYFYEIPARPQATETQSSSFNPKNNAAYHIEEDFPSAHYTKPYSGKCDGQLGCLDYQLTYTLDGPTCQGRFGNYSELVSKLARAGFSREETVNEGRRAAEFFKDKYGVDFTGLEDSAYIREEVVGEDLKFTVFDIPSTCLRLTSASHRDKSQFYNSPIRDSTWVLVFEKDFQSTGSVTDLIPAGSLSIFGSYLIDVCPDPSDIYNDNCKHSVLNPADPTAPIFIRFQSRNYLRTNLQPGGFLAADCELSNDIFGTGTLYSYLGANTNGIAVVNFPTTIKKH